MPQRHGTAGDVRITLRWEVGGRVSGCMLASDWTKLGSTQPGGVCLYKHHSLVNSRGHSLGVPGMDLASVPHSGHYLVKPASSSFILA